MVAAPPVAAKAGLENRGVHEVYKILSIAPANTAISEPGRSEEEAEARSSEGPRQLEPSTPLDRSSSVTADFPWEADADARRAACPVAC